MPGPHARSNCFVTGSYTTSVDACAQLDISTSLFFERSWRKSMITGFSSVDRQPLYGIFNGRSLSISVFIGEDTPKKYKGKQRIITSLSSISDIIPAISSFIAHLPGVTFQQAKHPLQCSILVSPRYISLTSESVSSQIPSTNLRATISEWLFSPRRLPLISKIFITAHRSYL